MWLMVEAEVVEVVGCERLVEKNFGKTGAPAALDL